MTQICSLMVFIACHSEPEFPEGRRAPTYEMEGVQRGGQNDEVRSYLLEVESLEEFTETLARIAIDLRKISTKRAGEYFAQLTQTAQPKIDCPLTKQEQKVLQLLALGDSYDEVADALEISLGTVQSHIKNLYRKLEVSNKIEAASLARRAGWFDD